MNFLPGDFVSGAIQSFIPGAANTQQGNYAGQVFQKRLSAIDYTIQWQQLHREDIRDLMQLTVGRMDIYHLVGTLLLTFGIEWYTDNMLMQERKVPFGFVQLFLICNFCSVGYLIFSVWLAMHASVAAQSIGTRLLTSFARLSIPSRQELEEISVSVTPLMDHFLALGKEALAQKMRRSEEGGAGPAAQGLAPPVAQAGSHSRKGVSGLSVGCVASAAAGCSSSAAPPRPSELPRLLGLGASQAGSEGRQHGWGFRQKREVPPPSPLPDTSRAPSASASASQKEPWSLDPRRARELATGGAAAENCDLDLEMHFRRFLEEQQRWLSYDAYSRTCMSLGMNQLLQALGYYVVGTVAQYSYMCTMMTLFGVMYIAVLLLRLDMVDGWKSSQEKAVVLATFILPTVLAGVVVWLPKDVDPEVRNLCLCPCFILHGGWALYVAHQTKPTAKLDENGLIGSSVLLPRRWRAVAYLNVIEVKQTRLAEEVHACTEEQRASPLIAACLALQRGMQTVSEKELANGCVSSAGRSSQALEELSRHLEAQMENLRSLSTGRKRPSRRALQHAEQVLQHHAVWKKTPDMLACLEALRSREVQAWLEDDQKQAIDQSYQAFLQKCQELQLGVAEEEEAPGPAQEVGNPGSSVPNPALESSVLHIEPGESRTVRVQTYWGSLQTVCVDRQGLTGTPPPLARQTSLKSALQDDLPSWASQAEMLAQRPAEGPGSFSFGGSEAAGVSPQSQSQACSSEGGADPSFIPGQAEGAARRWTPGQALVPPESMPPEELPGSVVRRFTLFTVCFWMVSGVMHFFATVYKLHQEPFIPGTSIPIAWPGPSSLFEATWLHCNASHVLAGNSFGVFAAQLNASGVGSFAKLHPTGPAVLLCGAEGCDALLQRGASRADRADSERWFVSSLGPVQPRVSLGQAEPVPIPPSWQLVTAAPSLGSCVAEACEIWLAGWDGVGVVVGMMTRRTPAMAPTEISSEAPDNSASLEAGAAGIGQGAGWSFEPHLAVRPGLGRCPAAESPPVGGSWVGAWGWAALQGQTQTGCETAIAGLQKYEDVRALHLGSEGRLLLVLLGSGLLDGWDLTSGTLLGRWRLTGSSVYAAPRDFAALCVRAAVRSEAGATESQGSHTEESESETKGGERLAALELLLVAPRVGHSPELLRAALPSALASCLTSLAALPVVGCETKGSSSPSSSGVDSSRAPAAPAPTLFA
ncbi:unnamed protein product [Polarella glacialis]|uniref:Uncharacterized protein n=1 Tax=Polarella glacialis TaxID=89957 RepID=A0A813ES48_POLGL|nr:unnamed protein product [Polarella glacialis]